MGSRPEEELSMAEMIITVSPDGELVVASPVYKQHFSLATGRCIEDSAVQVPVYTARVADGMVMIVKR